MHTRRPNLDALSLINASNVTKSLPPALETVDSHVAAWKAHNFPLFIWSCTCNSTVRPAASLNSVCVFVNILKNCVSFNVLIYFVLLTVHLPVILYSC